VQYCIGIVANIGSWWLMPAFGRRTILLGGQVGLFVLLVLTGIFSVSGLSQTSTGIATATLLLIFSAVYQSTVGPITYPIVNEIPSTRLKAKTVSLARAFYVAVSLFNGGIMPQMINTNHWNWGAKTGWFWAVITALCAAYTFFRVPETKGLSFEEIDLVFSRKIDARDFKPFAEFLRIQQEAGIVSFHGDGGDMTAGSDAGQAVQLSKENEVSPSGLARGGSLPTMGHIEGTVPNRATSAVSDAIGEDEGATTTSGALQIAALSAADIAGVTPMQPCGNVLPLEESAESEASYSTVRDV
jgi:hypothetical protein